MSERTRGTLETSGAFLKRGASSRRGACPEREASSRRGVFLKRGGRWASERGYTIIELLMALFVFAIGITGIAAMQSVTAGANRHASNLAVATHIAESWQDRLAVEATEWTQDDSTLAARTEWLKEAATNNAGEWMVPVESAAGDFGPTFGALGQYTDDANQLVFCTHIRLTPLLSLVNVANNVDAKGNGLVRTEVRVFWPKDTTAWNSGADYCATGAATVTAVGAASEEFHFVYKTTAVRQTAGVEN